MTGNIVARRYANALYAVAQKGGEAELAAYGQELIGLAEAVEGTPEGAKFFRNPAFTAEEKKAVMKGIAEKAGTQSMVKNFCDLLADKGRLEYLSDIAAVYKSMLDDEQGVISGSLITAKELTADRQAAIKTDLEQRAGKKIELVFEVDEEILGGVVLKVGDKVLNASIRAQLEILKENIKRGE